MTEVNFAVVTVSTSSYADPIRDHSGPALIKYLEEKSSRTAPWIHLASTVVPDDRVQLKETLLKLCDELRPDLLLTTGGTGISPDDVTPEATRDVVTREIPGMSQTMIAKSLSITPMAMLSRPVCGVYQQTLIINLPGSQKGCVECLDFVYPILRHAIDLIRDRRRNVAATHAAMQENSKIYDSCCSHQDEQFVISEEDQIKCEGRRARHSPFPMISVDEAMTMIFNQLDRLNVVEKSLTEALNYICVEEIVAEEPFPPFRASVKDGYAVRLFAEENHEQIYEIVGRSDAGGDDNDVTLNEGQCVVINTGAKVPDTADAVIQIEDTKVHERTGDDEKSIRITSKCRVGQDIRAIGTDVKIGEVVLGKETLLGPAELALLATVGAQKIRVFDQPRVVVISTGNELVPVDTPSSTSGKIRDSNKIMLISALKMSNIATIIDGGTAKDDETSVIETLRKAFEQGDVIISTGGVSMGDRDLIKSVLTNHFQATIHFGRVNMKPGKPTTFATCVLNGKKKLFFGLPGNPVSALVTYWLFLVPTLKRLMGHRQPHHPVVRVQLDRTIERFDSRPEFLRAEIEWRRSASMPVAKIISPENQCSSRLLSARRCTGLVCLPSETEIEKTRSTDQFDCLLLSL